MINYAKFKFNKISLYFCLFTRLLHTKHIDIQRNARVPRTISWKICCKCSEQIPLCSKTVCVFIVPLFR